MTWSCPGCGADLGLEILGALSVRRCGRCKGLWLDPPTFRGLAGDDGREPAAVLPPSPGTHPAAAPGPDPARCRACPECGDVMGRAGFARVSGVTVDVCRPHGAWLDAGELAAIRRFVRAGGLARVVARKEAPLDLLDLVRVAADLEPPSRWRTPGVRLLLAAGLAAVGVSCVWEAFTPHGAPDRLSAYGALPATVGALAVYSAWNAFVDAVDRWQRRS